jgi:peptidoglycan hydrolase CwlO-like protein
LSAAVIFWCLVVKQRAGLLLSGTVLASIFVAAPALAQDAQTDQMQRQINALQKQLQALQSQVTETKQQAKAVGCEQGLRV